MTKTNFRELCDELLGALENEGYTHWVRHTPDDDELCLRARAALAEPEPEGPTTGGKKPLSLVCYCYMKGMPPNPHQDWHAYFDHCAATGTISGLKLEAIQPTPSVNDSIPYSIPQQTEPEGPTDEELLCIAAKSIEPYDQILPGEHEPETNGTVEVYGSELIIYARAVLARWGNHPASPDSSTSPRSEND